METPFSEILMNDWTPKCLYCKDRLTFVVVDGIIATRKEEGRTLYLARCEHCDRDAKITANGRHARSLIGA